MNERRGHFQMTEWTKDKEDKLIKRYRFTLAFKIIQIGLLFGLLYFIYINVLNIAYDSTDISRKHHFNMSVAMDWKEPISKINYDFMAFSEVSPFFTQSYELPIHRRVGKEFKTIGTLKAEKKLLDSRSNMELHYFETTQDKRFRFYLPVDYENGNKLNAGRNEQVWETLEMIHEGTVADFAFSLDEYMDPEEVVNLLKQYDIDILWMPLYTGEGETFNIGRVFGYADGIQHLEVGGIGIRGILNPAEDDYMSLTYSYVLADDTVEGAKDSMLMNMKRLLDSESTNYLEDFLGLHFLEQRYQYLKENGFQAYGAVITGPVKEILKLQQLENIRAEQLGQLNYWNWHE